MLILGVTGMLGQAVMKEFVGFAGEVIVTSRSGEITNVPAKFKQVRFDASTDSISELLNELSNGDSVINCIGIIKAEIDESSEDSRERAFEINKNFPARLAAAAEQRKLHVIQIATDCVFSGKSGHYLENSPHDATDVYGISKSMGEIPSPAMMHLRVSIIGPEIRNHTSLYDWVARQEESARITGYTNHFWNGIPAKHFGKIARGIIQGGLFAPGVHHVLPADEASKSQLVRVIAMHEKRTDLQIIDGPAPMPINRTLSTLDPNWNAVLWARAGYVPVPTIEALVDEI